MIPCFTRGGMMNVISWYVGERIIGQFDREYAEYLVKKAADPTYKSNPYAEKLTRPRKTEEEALKEFCAKVKERNKK
jgi:hypothetical protein